MLVLFLEMPSFKGVIRWPTDPCTVTVCLNHVHELQTLIAFLQDGFNLIPNIHLHDLHTFAGSADERSLYTLYLVLFMGVILCKQTSICDVVTQIYCVCSMFPKRLQKIRSQHSQRRLFIIYVNIQYKCLCFFF